MKLMTAEITKKLPKLYAQDGKGMEALVIAKFFNPCGSQTWYVTEGESDEFDDMDGSTLTTYKFFGYVTGMGSDEFGYFMLNELEAVRGRFGLGIERDIHFPVGKLTLAQAIKS